MNDKIKQKLKTISTEKLLDLNILLTDELLLRETNLTDDEQRYIEGVKILEECGIL